jgi:hypothetical protein
MQIPSTLRPKLVTLDSPVKAAMLKSSHTLGLVNVPGSSAPPTSTPSLRRAKSSDSLSPTPSRVGHAHSPSLDLDLVAPFARPNFAPRPHSGSFEGERTASLDISSPFPAVFPAPENGKSKPAKSKGNKDKEKEKEKEKDLSAEAMCAWLAGTKSSVLEVEKVKKLRILLRNETAR